MNGKTGILGIVLAVLLALGICASCCVGELISPTDNDAVLNDGHNQGGGIFAP